VDIIEIEDIELVKDHCVIEINKRNRMSESKSQTTILIIDDQLFIWESYIDYLKSLDFRVLTAENGRTGLELFEREEVHLILVDLRMPEVDGLEVLSRVRESSPDTPLIVVSGTGIIADAVEALHYGAWDYLLKPIEELSVLIHAIMNALEKARLRQENVDYQRHLERMVTDRTSELRKKTDSLEQEIILRKETEEKLKVSLQEKEVLIQEIHHRVKNNMAVITSLLGLKEESFTDIDIKQMLRDIQQRIKSMALVHEKLYGSNNLKYISVKEYISDLLNDLIVSYNNQQQNISWQLHIEDLPFTLDLLIPLGLITNEILTNSIKHAFDGISEPHVLIKLKEESGDIIEFKIADNGIGFKENKEFANNNPIGIEIVKALVEQIHGSIELSSSNGTEYVIRFPYHKHFH